jgi:uncharacterized protein YjbJ (UPF0337 family)
MAANYGRCARSYITDDHHRRLLSSDHLHHGLLRENIRGKEINIMSGKAEEVKGRVKEAAGVVTNDERLKHEGKVDQASGKIKQATEKVVNKIRDTVRGE